MFPVPKAEAVVASLHGVQTDAAEGMPPHVTLIYPFTDHSQLGAGPIGEVRALVRRFVSFEFSLTEVRRFDNLPDVSYVWLAIGLGESSHQVEGADGQRDGAG